MEGAKKKIRAKVTFASHPSKFLAMALSLFTPLPFSDGLGADMMSAASRSSLLAQQPIGGPAKAGNAPLLRPRRHMLLRESSHNGA